MGSQEFLPASLPMNSVHLINAGLDTVDEIGKGDHVIKLPDPSGAGLGLGHQIIHGSG